MNKKEIIDERIIQSQQKIESDACRILLVILFASVIIQQYAFQVSFSQFAVELFVVIGIVLYIVLRNITAGNDYKTDPKNLVKPVLKNALLTGLAIMIINGIINYAQYGDRYSTVFLFLATLAVTFISATIGSAVLFSLFSLLSSKKQQEIAKDLDAVNN